MPEPNPYEGLSATSLIVRDHLALDRTRLANERTLLAYIRSGMTLMLAGVSFVYFAGDSWLAWVGLACIPGGVLTLLAGIWRFVIFARRLRRMGRSPPVPD